MQIIPISSAKGAQIEQAASVLIEALREFSAGWEDLDSASVETRTFLTPERLAFLALENDVTVGWIGAIRHTGDLWELHPLVVLPDWQGKGIGKELVNRLEAEARKAGVTTIWLGTDDDFGGTNLYGKELFPNVLEQLATLRAISRHPFTFCQKLGYTVAGVIPDASGPGKPDILMVKRV
jgi:aminoglycoside 6'-N-acetyltransferase I